jgi:isopentenyl diphosphate isomerase/L-lactate dehydrogenase-like FMN-dependent dehydrogenase
MAGSTSSTSSGPMTKAYNIEDLRTMARRRLPKVIFDYLDGGADDEVTLRNNRGVMLEHMQRCAEAGYSAMMLTIDCATSGNRERDFYNGFGFPMKMTPRRILDGMLHPAWAWSYLASKPMSSRRWHWVREPCS